MRIQFKQSEERNKMRDIKSSISVKKDVEICFVNGYVVLYKNSKIGKDGYTRDIRFLQNREFVRFSSLHKENLLEKPRYSNIQTVTSVEINGFTIWKVSSK